MQNSMCGLGSIICDDGIEIGMVGSPKLHIIENFKNIKSDTLYCFHVFS